MSFSYLAILQGIFLDILFKMLDWTDLSQRFQKGLIKNKNETLHNSYKYPVPVYLHTSTVQSTKKKQIDQSKVLRYFVSLIF